MLFRGPLTLGVYSPSTLELWIVGIAELMVATGLDADEEGRAPCHCVTCEGAADQEEAVGRAQAKAVGATGADGFRIEGSRNPRQAQFSTLVYGCVIC